MYQQPQYVDDDDDDDDDDERTDESFMVNMTFLQVFSMKPTRNPKSLNPGVLNFVGSPTTPLYTTPQVPPLIKLTQG